MPRVSNNAPGWGHTHAIAAATTDANVLKDTGSLFLTDVVTDVGAAASCGAVGCTGAHPNGPVGVLNTRQIPSSAATKVAAVTAIPTGTGVAR